MSERKERCETCDSNNAVAMLARHQWAGRAHGAYGSIARQCPECGGMHPDDAINNGCGHCTTGKGHKQDCALAAAIGLAPAPAEAAESD